MNCNGIYNVNQTAETVEIKVRHGDVYYQFTFKLCLSSRVIFVKNFAEEW